MFDLTHLSHRNAFFRHRPPCSVTVT